MVKPPLCSTDTLLKLCIALVRFPHEHDWDGPVPGDLVVEVTSLRREPDPDAIGILVGHDEAAYSEDGTGPKREVWDVLPLRGLSAKHRERGYLRWENAEFRKVPSEIVVRVPGLLEPRHDGEE